MRAERPLRHAKPHVNKDRYIKAFDPAVIAAMKTLQTTLDTLKQKCSNRAAGKLADCAKLLKTRRGEVAEWLKAAVC